MNEETLFIEALEIADPADRAAFLDRACAGNPDVRSRVDRLLAQHAQAGSFLGQPAALPATGPLDAPGDSSTHVRPDARSDGGVIGPYKLVEVIGEGGMGTVWLAQQQEPVKRLVALKVIKAGMDSKGVLARFEAERQALALMDHPNIAKVLDAGATSDGHPYFVMELVKGVPITTFCDERTLTPRERLELFVPVCQAIQHAHQKGVIHRDIKPSNVLVALYDGRPVPKVIDFGIAKAAGQPLTEKTLITGLGAVVGTPEYMSPEQAELNQLDIDTRSDVYSLGILLYELLTGTTPLQRKRVKEAALLEVLRLVREEEPPRPSTRLSTTDELPSIAARRSVEPKKLSGLVRGELDWIVMKALEKDRNRRYETANGFAADVQRYLVDEPVQASPPSAGYRLRKFARRHKGPALAATLVLLTLLGGIVGTTWQAVRAERAREAEAQRADAGSRAKREAEERAEETRALLDFVEHGVLVARMVEPNPGKDRDEKAMLRRAVDEALPYVERFTDRPLIEARLRLTLGAAFNSLNEHALAAQQAERARSLYEEHRGPAHPDTLVAIHSLAEVYISLGRSSDALKLLGEKWERQRDTLGQDHADTLATRMMLADSHYANDQRAQGLKLCKEILSALAERKVPLEPGHSEVLAAMARGPYINAQPEEGIPLLERILAIQQSRLAKDHPDTLVSMKVAANCYAVLKRDSDAVKMLQDMLVIQRAKPGRENPEAIETMVELAMVHLRLKQYGDALRLCQAALASIQKNDFGQNMLSRMRHLPDRLDDDGRGSDGLRLREELLAVWKSKFPSHVEETLEFTDKVADSYTALGRHADAFKLYEEALKVRKAQFNDELLDTVVRTRDSRHEVVPMLRSMTGIADNFAALGRNAEAEEHYGQALKQYKVLLTRKDEEKKYLPHLRHLAAMTAAKLGAAQLLGAHKAEEPEARFTEAVKLCDCLDVHCRIGSAYARHSQWRKAADAFRTALDRNPKHAPTYVNLGWVLSQRGNVAEAVAALGTAIELDPNSAWAQNQLAWLLATSRDPKFRDPDRAVVLARKAVELDPKNREHHNTLGVAHYRAGDWAAAIAALEKSMGLRNGGDAFDWYFLAMAHWRLGEKGKAREVYDRAVQWMDRHQPTNEELRRFRVEAAELLAGEKKND